MSLPVCIYTQLEIFCFFISTRLHGIQVEISQVRQAKQIFGCLWVDGFALVAIFHNDNVYLLVLIKAVAGEPLESLISGRLFCVNSE